jgi:alanine dehydrogenase
MRIGVPKEIKVEEHRVGLSPAAARELAAAGHDVLVESAAERDAGFEDTEFEAAGAHIIESAAELFEQAELIVKVKELQAAERARLRPGQVLFSFLHLAADPEQARSLMTSKATAFAYETVTAPSGGLPLLAPMSRIAGRLSVQVGAHCLEKPSGGRGVLLGGVPGVAPGRVLVLGAGVAGSSAVEMAVGMEADVTALDKNIDRLDALAQRFGNRVRTVYSSADSIAEHVRDADLVIGSVLIPGRSAPKLVTREMVAAMPTGSVVVDISIDQGGCFETSKPTNHDAPTYVVDGVLHYCVTNMPGAVPRTATLALVNATLPFVKALADLGWEEATTRDPHLAEGLNVHAGELRNRTVAADLQANYGLPPRAA